MPETPITASQTIHPNNKENTTPVITYSKAAEEYINFRRMRLIAACDMRDMNHEEFDNMPFLKYYDLMKKADDQYVAPRKNAQDTSINLGTIRDKDTALVEYAAKYDFEPVAQVYDDSNELLDQMAEVGEDLVRKSYMLEDFRAKSKLIDRSFVSFGTALVEDAYVERWTIEKEFGTGGSRIGSKDTTWTERKVKQYDGCQAKLWDLRKCYFGDIRKFFMNGPQGQPYFFTVEYESYDVVKQLFGDWDRWQYVPTTVVMTPETSSAAVYTAWWTLRPVSMNYVEIVRYYDPIANEFAITLNGVDMLPILEKETKANDGTPKTLISAFPLTAVSPSGAIPFAKFDLEPMHDFAYSKSQPAKMRVTADVENMIFKLMLGMMKQKAKPTMGNSSGRSFGPEVTDPASVINDIRDGDLFPVLPNYMGAQPADFSFLELVKKESDKQSVERSFQGMDNPSPQDETATADMNNSKAQSLKVAALFDGKIFGMNQLSWLRTYNISKNWTKPVDSRVDQEKKLLVNSYRTVTMPAEVGGGEKATKKIIFTKDTGTKSSQDIHQEELDTQKKSGSGPVRIAYLHPEQFAVMKLNWFYTHVPVPTGSDPLGYMMFAKQIQDATLFFGPQSLNVKKLKHKFAAKTGEDFDTWFLGASELAQSTSMQPPQGGNAPAGGAPQPGQNNSAPPMGAPNPAGAGASSNNLMAKVPQLAMK